MEQATLSSKSVLEALLKTNRPPTNQETAIIRESMAPTNAKLTIIEAQICDAVAHIQALNTKAKQAETKLQRLRDEEAAILETLADHRRAFSPFQNLPEDILREICIACVEDEIPKLSYYLPDPLPYVLAQISSVMRQIALTTPLIWASMHIKTRSLSFDIPPQYEEAYSTLARRASQWFDRAGGVALTVFIEDPSIYYERTAARFYEPGSYSEPSSILFDTIFSYSTRWKEIQFVSHCQVIPAPMLRIATLTAVDVPLLQSVSLRLETLDSNPVLADTVLLTIPTLKHVTLETYVVQIFTVNWAILTSVTLREFRTPDDYRYCYSKSDMARILQQTKCLVFCDIVVGADHSQEHAAYSDEISLPCLKTLIIGESTSATASNRVPGILDQITAPILEIFHIHEAFFDFASFFERSPCIWELSLRYFDTDNVSLTDMLGFLRYCPSLTSLFLWPKYWYGTDTRDANRFLRAFVEEGDAGIICPHLQHFDFTGNIDFSLETLRLFLEGKQGEVTIPNVWRWKKVVVDIGGIKAEETRQQMLDLVSQKKAAGLDVEVMVWRQ